MSQQLVPALIPRAQPLLGPISVGTDGQVLSSDGLGGTYWADMAGGGGGVTDHGLLTGLLDDDHIQYVRNDGRAGGQTIHGGTLASQTLTLASTLHATKGNVNVGVGTVVSGKGAFSVNASGYAAGDTDAFKVEWPNSTGNSAKKVRFINGTVDVLSWSGSVGWVFGKEIIVTVAADPMQVDGNGGNFTYGVFTIRQQGWFTDRFTAFQHLGSQIYGRLGIGNGWSNANVAAQVNINAVSNATPTLNIQAITSQTTNLLDFRDSSSGVVAAFTNNAAWKPPSLADTSAANGTVYYSTTANKLVFKDSGGAVNALY